MHARMEKGDDLSVQSAIPQQGDVVSNSQDRRLANNPLQVMSPNQAIPSENQEGDTFNLPNLVFSQAQRNEIFGETSSRMYRELCGPQGVVLQEQQENIGQIVNEIYRLREELAKLKLTLKQGFVIIDEPCAKHVIVLDGLQSFAGSQMGANQRVQGTLRIIFRNS